VNAVSTSTHAPVTQASAPAKTSTSKALQAQKDAPAKKVDVSADIHADKELRAQRLSQALDKSQLNYSFDKRSRTLSVKVVHKQSGEFIRQIDFHDFLAMTFSSHGYKGQHIDNQA
jgi:uncharacterized FlaG/YvyC family protein